VAHHLSTMVLGGLEGDATRLHIATLRREVQARQVTSGRKPGQEQRVGGWVSRALRIERASRRDRCGATPGSGLICASRPASSPDTLLPSTRRPDPPLRCVQLWRNKSFAATLACRAARMGARRPRAFAICHAEMHGARRTDHSRSSASSLVLADMVRGE
jgi:hypothetical protein